jgi:hypothetical protein
VVKVSSTSVFGWDGCNETNMCGKRVSISASYESRKLELVLVMFCRKEPDVSRS